MRGSKRFKAFWVVLFWMFIVGLQAGFALTVTEVLEKYVSACGGRGALMDIRSETRSGTLVRGTSGQVPFTVTAQTPGLWLYQQVFAFGERVQYGCDGAQAWVQDNKGVGVLGSEEWRDLRLLFDIQAPLKLDEWYPKLKIQGEGRLGEKDVVIQRAGCSVPSGCLSVLPMKGGDCA